MRTFKTGVAALAAVAALWAFLRWRAAADPILVPLRGASPGAVVKLEVSRNGMAGVYEKKAGRWSGEPERCEALAAAAATLKLQGSVSRDPDTYGSYGVDEPSAVRLRVWLEGEAAPALDAYIGRPAFGGGTAYVRLKEEQDVRLATGLASDFLK